MTARHSHRRERESWRGTLAAIWAVPLLLAAAPASARSGSDRLISNVSPGLPADELTVEITFVGAGPQAQNIELPREIPARLTIGNVATLVTLRRDPAYPDRQIAAKTFVRADYRLHLPSGIPARSSAFLTLGQRDGPGYSFVIPATPEQASLPEDRSAPQLSSLPVQPGEEGQAPAAKPDKGNAFLANLSSYAPIYAVYGPGTDTDARVQISFKYQLFGKAGEVGPGNSVANGFHFAYTQRMFWDVGAESAPFRNIDFLPELFFLVPARRGSDSLSLGAQLGLRHESNGRDGAASRSLNAAYIQPILTAPVGRYTLSIGPRLELYIGSLSDNPDIKRYRGNTALFAEIGTDDGLRLTTSSRFNFTSGKGAVDAALSYPLPRIFGGGPNLYLFGQGFAGYGENLLDYDRKVTRLRFGLGIVR